MRVRKPVSSTLALVACLLWAGALMASTHGPPAGHASGGRNGPSVLLAQNEAVPRAAAAPALYVAFVIDTTLSMGEYPYRVLDYIEDLTIRAMREGFGDNLYVGVVAFRSSPLAAPNIEYTTRIISDFKNMTQSAALLRRLARMRTAGRSSHSFNEDSFAGLETAIHGLSWPANEDDAKIIFLVTDAGPLPNNDPHRATNHTPWSLGGLARIQGLSIITIHVKTRAGRKNHAWAEDSYRAMGEAAGDWDNYIDVNGDDPSYGLDSFGAVADAILMNLEDQLLALDAYRQETSAQPPASSQPPAPAQPAAPAFGGQMAMSPADRFVERVAPLYPPPELTVREDPQLAGMGQAAAAAGPTKAPSQTAEEPSAVTAFPQNQSPAASGPLFSSSPSSGPPPSTEEVKALLRSNPPADTQRLERALALLENSPGADEEVFLLIRVLAKRVPQYKLRLGAFFDPTDPTYKRGVKPNVKYAYDEYQASGLPEAKARIDRLFEWSYRAEAQGVDGLEEFREAVR